MAQGAVAGIVYGLNKTTGLWRRLPGALIYADGVYVAKSRNAKDNQYDGVYRFCKPGNSQITTMYCTKDNWITWYYGGGSFLVVPLQTCEIDIYMIPV